MTQITTGRVTFEEFLELTMDQHAEWVDGTIVPMHAVNDRHDGVVRWLNELLGSYVRRRKLGRLFGEPFVTKLGPGLPGRSPDLFFVATENLGRVRKTFLQGPPDLAIEVISPWSRRLDRVYKRADYERAGVREYWVIDPKVREAIFYGLNASGALDELAVANNGEFVSGVLPEVRLQLAWLWQEPQPDVIEVLRGWGAI